MSPDLGKGIAFNPPQLNTPKDNNSNLLNDIAKLKGFKIAALNIVSLSKYIDQLRLYLSSHPLKR